MTEINLAGISLNENIASPLKEYVLLEQNTTLSLEAYLLSPQSAALVFHQIPNTFKRLMLIGWNKNLVQQFLGKIISHNQHIMHFDRANDDFLTGFFLDNGNNFIVYVEGHSVGGLQLFKRVKIASNETLVYRFHFESMAGFGWIETV